VDCANPHKVGLNCCKVSAGLINSLATLQQAQARVFDYQAENALGLVAAIGLGRKKY
jgi:hypothetical protein